MSIPQAHTAIITVTYNSSDFIDEYLEAIYPFINTENHKLFIVDSHSNDDTRQRILKYIKDKGLEESIYLIALSENAGFGKGCNAGVEAAQIHTPTYLWFLNPDTRVYRDSGEQLQKLLDNPSYKADFAGSVLVDEKGNPRPGAFRFPTLTTTILATLKIGFLDRLLKQHTTAIKLENEPYQADWLTGASFMVKAKHFYKLKGFDPYYFLYFEEVDLFFRAKHEGLSAWACPSSKVFHISGASTGINNAHTVKRLPDYWFESRKYFYTKNYGTIYLAAIDLGSILATLLWRLRATIQQKDDDSPPHYIRSILKHRFSSLRAANHNKG